MNVHLKLLSPEAFVSPKCTKYISFGGRAPPGPAGGAYSAPPDPLAGLRGLLLREGERRGGDRRGEKWGGKGKGKKRREGKGKG